MAAIRPLPPADPEASLAAFTVPGVAEAISQSIDADLKAPGVTDVTANFRGTDRLVNAGKAGSVSAATSDARPATTMPMRPLRKYGVMREIRCNTVAIDGRPSGRWASTV